MKYKFKNDIYVPYFLLFIFYILSINKSNLTIIYMKCEVGKNINGLNNFRIKNCNLNE